MLPHANGKPLPTLNITTRPSSAPPTPRPGPGNASAGTVPRSSTPKPTKPLLPGRSSSMGLGPPPQLNQAKIDEMLALDHGQPIGLSRVFVPSGTHGNLNTADNLSLLPLHLLNAHLDTLRGLTATSSSLLSHLLQTRATLQEESESYNSIIGEMIAKEALKMRTGVRRKNSARGSVER